MPTYEYRCSDCGHQLERFQFMSEQPLGKGDCPVCHGDVVRLISGGAGLLFKGSGFYITDYRSDEYKRAVKSETSKPADKPQAKAETN
jgi:putative FmdB family regulatory protein